MRTSIVFWIRGAVDDKVDFMSNMARLTDIYLNHLRVERGLAPKSIDAYARDIASFADFLDSCGCPVEASHAHWFAPDGRRSCGGGRSAVKPDRTVTRGIGAHRILSIFPGFANL